MCGEIRLKKMTETLNKIIYLLALLVHFLKKYLYFPLTCNDQGHEAEPMNRSSHRKCSIKKLFLKNLQNLQITPVLESLF